MREVSFLLTSAIKSRWVQITMVDQREVGEYKCGLGKGFRSKMVSRTILQFFTQVNRPSGSTSPATNRGPVNPWSFPMRPLSPVSEA